MATLRVSCRSSSCRFTTTEEDLDDGYLRDHGVLIDHQVFITSDNLPNTLSHHLYTGADVGTYGHAYFDFSLQTEEKCFIGILEIHRDPRSPTTLSFPERRPRF